MNNLTIAVAAIVAACSISSCDVLFSPQSTKAVATVFAAGEGGYNIYRIPAIVKAANGDLLTFAEGRKGGDASELDIVMKRSPDNGLSWGPLSVVQESDNFVPLLPPGTAVSVGNPAPVVDRMDPRHPGRIWLPFTLENDRVFVSYSDDHGYHWSAAKEITATVKAADWGWYATGPVHSIQIQHGVHAGRMVIPSNHRLGKGGSDSGATGAQVIFSDNHGELWQIGAVDNSYTDDLNPSETTVVELVDGRLLFNTRDEHGSAPGTRGDAYSDDGGASFTPPVDTRYQYFEPSSDVLDPPVVQGALLRAASKSDGDRADVILFSAPDSNGPWGKGRSDLMIRYSLDEGKHWRDGLRINIGPAAYSDLVRLGQDHYGVVFETGKYTAHQRIDFAHFTLSDLNGIHP